MGTRGMIQVFDSSNKLLANIYVHSDMYPDGMMCEVAKFLRKRFFVNGIGGYFKDVDGVNNLAALIVAYLINWSTNEIRRLRRLTNLKKDDLAAGFVYLLPFDLNIENADVEYAYELRPMMDEEALYKAAVSSKKPKVLDVIKITAKKWDGKGAREFFDGTLRDFAKQYCKF
jgi:hypothetical protein